MIADLPIFLLGIAAGAIPSAALTWKLMIFGADRVVDVMIRQGYFIRDGARYNVTLNNSRRD